MKMKNNGFIYGEKIYLRAYKSDDEGMILRLENHPDPRRTLFYALPTTIIQQQDKIKNQIDDPNSIIFTICRKDDGEPVGQTALFRIDWIGRMAVFYIGIADKENWSKGYGSEATKLVIDYAFQTINLNRIQLHVAVENEAAVNLYKKVGFQIEGTLREAMFHQGKYCDFYVMGLLRKDLHDSAEQLTAE